MSEGRQGRQYLGTDPRQSGGWSSQSSRKTVIPPMTTTAYASTAQGSAAHQPASSYGTAPVVYSSATYTPATRPLQYSNTVPAKYFPSQSSANPPLSATSAYTGAFGGSAGQQASHFQWHQTSTAPAGYGSSAPRNLRMEPSAGAQGQQQRRSIPSSSEWQDYDARDITTQARPQQRPYPGTTGPVGLDTSFERLSFQPSGQTASAQHSDPRRSSQESRQGRRDSVTAGSRMPHGRQSSGQQRQLADGFKKRKGKFYEVGRVFHMIEDTPHGDDSDDRTSTWTYNSYGQRIYTKPRRFIVVQQNLQSCLVVPITTYSGRGVAKEKVKKSDHCIAYSGSIVPEPHPSERPDQNQGEMPMQASPIKIDPDELGDKLDSMSRIDFATPRRVDHYATVKNYGKVNPRSLHALVSQFQNVMTPTRPTRTSLTRAPTTLLSSRSKYLQAYHALLNFGWTPQEAAEFVNVNIRASRSTAEAAAADVSSGESDVEAEGQG